MHSIYIITNTHTGKVYVGRGKSIAGRRKHHRSALRHNRHWNPAMQADYNADPDSWEWCKTLEEVETLEEALRAETEWIKAFPEVYNYFGRDDATSHRAKLSKARRGNPLTAEHRAKLSKAALGRKFTDEHRAKIAASVKAAYAKTRSR
ncbi:hypothetical protein DBA29_20310 [Xenophilus aerolatus]|nr:hypothetical protein [Xenophilus aerolatus]